MKIRAIRCKSTHGQVLSRGTIKTKHLETHATRFLHVSENDCKISLAKLIAARVHSEESVVVHVLREHARDAKVAEISMLLRLKIQLNPLQNAAGLRFAGRRLVIVAAIWLVAAALPSSAVASCGNYLFRHGKAVDATHASMSDPSDARSQKSETNRQQSEFPETPCHGPNCSGNPIPLMPVPVAPTNLVRGFDQAAVLESLAQTPILRRAVEIPTSERGACFVPSSIFRPPMV